MRDVKVLSNLIFRDANSGPSFSLSADHNQPTQRARPSYKISIECKIGNPTCLIGCTLSFTSTLVWYEGVEG